MEEIREKIIEELLHKIEVNMDTVAVEDSVAVFSEFVKALTLEANLVNPDAEVDESAKQQTEAADAHMRDLGILFQLLGDHQKEVDEIFARMDKSATATTNESDKHRNANEVTQLLDIIKSVRKYVKQAYLNAETRYATPGNFYMDESLYLIMEESKELLSRMDSVVNASTKTLKDAGII